MSATAELRLKKPQRGWYSDKSPGLHGLNQAFADIAKGEGRKVAFLEALSKYGLLDDKGNPVDCVVKLLMENDFGYGDRGKSRIGDPRTDEPVFGPASGLSSGGSDLAGGGVGSGSGHGYGGV